MTTMRYGGDVVGIAKVVGDEDHDLDVGAALC